MPYTNTVLAVCALTLAGILGCVAVIFIGCAAYWWRGEGRDE
jgi:hypothetical protein